MSKFTFTTHPELAGKHAFLGASDYHWLNDDEEKLKQRYFSFKAKLRGTELHELAAKLIKEKIKVQKTKTTFNMYVNDAIGFDMTPEVTIKYSDVAYGTADAICYKNNVLRIHDLKTGKTPASMKQLKIYAAFFCLEYGIRPSELEMIELRIYQNDDKDICNPSAEEITEIINKIIAGDKIIHKIKKTED